MPEWNWNVRLPASADRMPTSSPSISIVSIEDMIVPSAEPDPRFDAAGIEISEVVSRSTAATRSQAGAAARRHRGHLKCRGHMRLLRSRIAACQSVRVLAFCDAAQVAHEITAAGSGSRHPQRCQFILLPCRDIPIASAIHIQESAIDPSQPVNADLLRLDSWDED